MKQDLLIQRDDVYVAKHGNETIHVGHDQAVNWSVLVNDQWEPIDDARTLKDAKELGHAQFDRGKSCSTRLDWKTGWHLDERTRGRIANTCPVCGNPVTDDDEDALRCTDCGWERRYTTEELRQLPKHL